MSETGNDRSKVRPGEICEACGRRPVVQIVLRSRTLEIDPQGRPVGEIDGRVAICQQCGYEIRAGTRGLPPGRVIGRVNPETGKMEPA